ncbi:MAG TPA: tRNA (adenosine(37)-N6)-threonylcarbamoyltransferase complex ATPase subunit type 1 TsaE [Acidimicrobiales bacterium]|nr:tRNA (adenosine(37)-N6)-threonylcarbamoyltransferase complex ATPase subunit type 1 TsaE [Acidimicrobiales bacterium]
MTDPVYAGTGSADDTRALAGAIADLVRPGDVLLLVGGLGAGKTTFAQGFAARLGVDGPVTSPTFTLVRQYPCAVGQLLHADLYRLDRLAEVADLALSELLDSDAEGAVALVEWGDGAAAVLGPDALTVTLARPADQDDDDLRTVVVSGGGAAWADRWVDLAAALSRWAPGGAR